MHELTTAEEIWNDTKGKVDVLVIGVGTGGTLTGCGRALKPRKPSLKIIAVEPTTSPVLSGKPRGPHKIQGIGAGFIPSILDTSFIDEIVTVSSEMAFERLAHAWPRSRASPAASRRAPTLRPRSSVAERPDMAGKMIVTFAPSSAERYFSSDLFVDPQRKARGLSRHDPATARLRPKPPPRPTRSGRKQRL